ncbi:hypothetical protein [Roseateles terrae]|uniref:C-type lysozyme inhibitor domain-containing protein n=1 Tax=Roseateles terrae TaxID=431060 RepID=A0ABR6GPJ3_9BURK|nr:hypothetical protein [Roseateles terrae]MBB3194044.1 hypothetical protein [Roseateles terrae]
MPHSSDLRSRFQGGLHPVRRGLTLTLMMAAATAVQAAGAPPTLCNAQEEVQFSCSTGAKTVSLCASPSSGTIDALTYRYGVPGKVEMEYAATKANGQVFFATVMPAAPDAQVSQVWFDKGNTRYLMTECTGGECVKPAGLAVLRGDKVLMNARCVRDPANDLAWFNTRLVEFGNDASQVKSSTPLLRSEETDNNISELYKTGKAPR